MPNHDSLIKVSQKLNHACMLCNIGEDIAFFANDFAINLYGDAEGRVNLRKLIQNNQSHPFLGSVITEELKEKASISICELVTVTNSLKQQIVELQIAYTDETETEVFVILAPTEDSRLESVKRHIDTSHRAEAILENDGKLTVFYANPIFYGVFATTKETCKKLYHHEVANALRKDKKAQLLIEIQTGLENSKTFHAEIEIISTTGNKNWYTLDLQKYFVDDSCEKLVCSLVNIDATKRTANELRSFSQYFEAMQELSTESLYVIDVKSKILRQKGIAAAELGLPAEVPDFPKSTYSMIHTDDLEQFMEYVQVSMNGESSQLQLRLKLPSGEYNWYYFTSRPIYNELGEVSEILGKIKNIHQEMERESEYNQLNEYFNAISTLSGESLYTINVNTKVLRCQGITADELGLPYELTNFPESTMHLFHPDDRREYKRFIIQTLSGTSKKAQLRIKNNTGSYQWYEFFNISVRSQQGEVSEILGRIKNIQNQYVIKEENEILNRHFIAFQELSNDLLYKIDVKNKTLYHLLKTDRADNVGRIVPNYIHTFVESQIVHPDDARAFVQYSKQWFKGNVQTFIVRTAFDATNYVLTEIRGQKILDNDGVLVEILACASNVQEEYDLKEDNTLLNQYLEAMQAVSDDILYRVDVKEQTLHHHIQTQHLGYEGQVIPNYLETLIKDKIVHPDDAQAYLNYQKEWLADKIEDAQVRFRFESEEYQWYSIKGKKIFNEKGDLTEVFGKMVNVQKERDLKTNFYLVTQYLNAMQELTKNILFHIDVQTKTFFHSDPNAQGFGLPIQIPDFINSFIERKFVRPEDADAYREYSEKLLSGEAMEYQIQAAVGEGIYEWFDVKCKFIYDENGHPTEIFGMMENIQSKKELE